MRTSWAFASSACSALLLAGCGGEPSLAASWFAPGAGLTDVPDRRTNGSVDPVPTWRVKGGAVAFGITLRNEGDDTLMVTGVERDENGHDQQFVPEGIDSAVELTPGARMTVRVRGRAECNGRAAGQISKKTAQRFTLGDGTTRDVDLGALIEFACAR